MNFITQNWQEIVKFIILIGLVIGLIILYRKDKINSEYLDNLANYLDMIDDGQGIVPLLAAYAKQAVLAVEQMVKAGILQKTNEGRKNMALQIVNELATADGIELEEEEKVAVDSLIEAEVYALKK